MMGYIENISKSWAKGGRRFPGYIAIVRVPGDTKEVGLSALRAKLGWHTLSRDQVSLLAKYHPDTITFSGEDGDGCTGYGIPHNTLAISEESAEEWARKVKASAEYKAQY